MARRCRSAAETSAPLLTLLLLRANEPVSTERLVDQLWGEHPPRTATTSLQNTVAQLRKLLGPGMLHTRPAGYVLELDSEQLDLVRFERLAPRGAERRAAGASRGSCERRSRSGAVRRSPTRSSRTSRRTRSTGSRICGSACSRTGSAADLEVDVDADLVAELESLVRRNPLRERLRAQLMLALYRSGRQADALNAYHDARRTLVDELGIDPGTRAPGPVRVDPAPGALARARGAAGARGPLRRGAARAVGRAARSRSRPWRGRRRRRRAGDAARGAIRARRRRARPRVRLAGRRGPERHRAAARRAAPRARPRLRAVALHAWLAGLPPLLRRRAAAAADRLDLASIPASSGRSSAAGEDLDIVVYVASGRDRGKFLHISPDGAATVVDEPNAYTGLALDERSVLLKIHGHVDRSGTRERESFAVSEDDHIDYLVGDSAGTVPVQLAARLRRSHLLFLGYAVDDWSLRVFLRRVWGGDRLTYRSWAVQQGAEHVASELWHERGVEVYDVSLETYAGELARLTAALEDAA